MRPHDNTRLVPSTARTALEDGAAASNHIVLAGTVASDLSPRHLDGRAALSFRLAVPRPEGGGELYVDIVVPADAEGDILTGGRLAVAGRLDHQEWVGEDGIRRSRWLVVAEHLSLLDALGKAG